MCFLNRLPIVSVIIRRKRAALKKKIRIKRRMDKLEKVVYSAPQKAQLISMKAPLCKTKKEMDALRGELIAITAEQQAAYDEWEMLSRRH